jgi:tetratricopeptide (TPR) repeat protein
VVHPAASSHTQPVAHTNSNSRPHPTPPPMQVVEVEPDPVIVTTPDKTVATDQTRVEAPKEPAKAKPGVLHKMNPLNWFGSSKPDKKYNEEGLTPLPPPDSNSTALAPAVSQPPIKIVPPAPPTFPRYLYLSPRKPKSGDRVAASGAFTKAREFEQDSRWTDAMEWYRRATESDPTWFEAQYNYGVLAYRLQNYSPALAAYEVALTLAPDSTNAINARYQFALALKAAGYAVDAVNELKKVVAAGPDEVRAHLALGNLYAQQLRDPARARQHYLKVLELDPHNPQGTDIRFWLLSNPA